MRRDGVITLVIAKTERKVRLDRVIPIVLQAVRANLVNKADAASFLPQVEQEASFLFAQRLLGTLPALIGFLLVAFDPFHLSLSRILHPDAMLGNLMLLSLLAFVDYLRDRSLLSLLISGGAAGLAWLTKSPGFILVPVIGMLALYKAWPDLRIPLGGILLKRLWGYALPILEWCIAGILIFIAFWPALWVHPGRAISAIFSKAERYAEEGHSAPVFFNGIIAEDGELGLTYFYYYPLTFLWRSTPVVLAGLLLAAWGMVKGRQPFAQRGTRLVVVGFMIMSTFWPRRFIAC